VDDAAVLEILRKADASRSLPRLGGMARAGGVAIVSEDVWSYSRVDGGLSDGVMPRPPRVLARLPLARGLVRLGLALAPLFRSGGAAGPRERLFLLAAMFAPLPLVLAPAGARGIVAGVLTLALVGWMLRGRTLRLHGAEHRAITAAEERSLVDTWYGRARPSRFSPRCGTNFAALVLPMSVLLDRLWILPTAWMTPVLVTLAALTLTMELWLAAQRLLSSVGRFVMLPGMLLQRLTTREPRLEDTRVALRAVAVVLSRR
jgi:Protein of unknown function (DUF1385)